ncbi:MAG TPA: phosphodiester glycosidase family protein [Nocardioides sp.]|jgi:hypothetical protein|nr:phosphodiester glycosidase family protein [Nocardioides sp.]
MSSPTPRYVARALTTLLLGGGLATGLAAAGPTEADISHRTSWKVAPGVTYRAWRFTTHAGEQRVHVLEVNPARPGVSIGYRTNATLQMRAPLSRMVAHAPTAVAGTNGNYFDISDTGAPVGVGRSRARGVTHAPASGWNNAFYQASDGTFHVGTVALTGRLAQHPDWPVTGLNLPHARPQAITLYTPVWGKARGRAVVDGRRTPVREVHVKDGVVRQNTRTLLKGRTFQGYLLVGLGRGAKLLKTVKVGSRLDASWALDPKPQMAITGSQVLVQHGRVVATDDGQKAPRTAVGIDRATGHVVLATLDGRQKNAVGLSTLGWARFLKRYGVDAAVNLDGGGSTTMVARSADQQTTGVVNRPSLGRERWVPDALTVDYQAPK